MKLTKYGHSCLLVESGSDRILVDPGSFSFGWESLTGLSAVLITHQHADHVDLERLPAMLALNSRVQVFADPGTVEALSAVGVHAASVDAGDTLDLTTPVEVFGETHAVIHRDIPTIANRGYLVDGRLYLPGDSLQVPSQAVEVLALPVAAPWMALKESVEFVRAVDPTTVFPIHEKILANPAMAYGLLEKLKPADSQWINLDGGETTEI